jgi:hypothetical protein
MLLEPGTVLVFPLCNGMHGACRVLRHESANNEEFKGVAALAYATQWVGDAEPDLKDPALRKVLRTPRGPVIYWIRGPLPTTFTPVGSLGVRKAEANKSTNSTSVWDIFPNVVFSTWAEANDRAALDRSLAKEKEEHARKIEPRLQAYEDAGETIDLAGVLHPGSNKTDREPEDVVRSFIVAMNRWENESARIFDAWEITPEHFNREAQEQVFNEFCTPKKRKYGRLGSFQQPPEYDPVLEDVMDSRTVSKSRVEVDTVRREMNTKTNYTYVLLKKGGAWLIDSLKREGENWIL